MMKRNIFRERIFGIAFGFMIVAFLLVGCAGAAHPAGTEFFNGKEAAAGEVLVKFRTATSSDIINQVQFGENVDEAEHLGSAQVLRFHSRSKNVTTMIKELSARADVKYAEPNYIVHAVATPSDTYFSQLWGLQKISAPSAWDISTGTTANVVAVVDTGIDYTHPDLAANIWSAPTAFAVTIDGLPITCPAGSHGFNAITKTCNPMDDNNHGTHVSGTIGAIGNNGMGVVGVNWKASVMGSKFLDSTGSGYLSDAINAIDFTIQAKKSFAATGGANVRVLSNSWGGGGFSQALLDEINTANDNDMLFVAAAGNSASNNDLTPSYPSSYSAPNVVAVAATDSSDLLASWSNYGPSTVHLGAPGVNILSTIRNGGYASYSGTSMATPHVSGAAALILSKCTLNTAGLKADILNNVDPIPSLTGKTVTGGRLDINKALRACSAPTIPTTTMLIATPGSSTYGVPVTFTAQVTPSGGTGIPTGTVRFSDGSSVLGTGILTSGQTTFTTSTLSGGLHSITAIYGGDSSFSGSTSNAVPFTVNLAPSMTILTSSMNPSTFGQQVTFSATVSPPAATGTITFYDGSTSLGTVTLSSGNAKFSTSTLTVGGHLVTATYGGDSNITSSTSSTLTQMVNSAPASDFSLSSSPSSRTITRGAGTTYTISITRLSGFTGSVVFGVSGLPSGASGAFSPNPATGTSSKLTITTKSTTPHGTYPLIINGTSSSLSHQTNVTLIVNARH